jgi:hypothetical protein
LRATQRTADVIGRDWSEPRVFLQI